MGTSVARRRRTRAVRHEQQLRDFIVQMGAVAAQAEMAAALTLELGRMLNDLSNALKRASKEQG